MAREQLIKSGSSDAGASGDAEAAEAETGSSGEAASADACETRSAAPGDQRSMQQVSCSGTATAANGGIAVSGIYNANTVVSLPPEVLRPAAEVNAPAGLDDLRDRPHHFVGRGDELDLLDAALNTPGSALVQVVHGLGGIGKSALAAHWAATRPHGRTPARWISADSPAGVQQGLADLATALQPASTGLLRLPAEVLAEYALQWLATHTGWLLILDDVNDPADIAHLVARAPAGRFLITSRLAAPWPRATTLVRLDVLGPAESLDLLTGITTAAGPRDLDGAAELCEELGHLPLALEQVSAYLAQNTLTTPRAYLALLAGHPAAMYCQGSATTRGEGTIARIWNITLDRITALEPLATDLLRILAWYAPENIPVTLFGSLADPPAVNQAIGLLIAYSMITPDPGTGTVAVHRLVQALGRTPEEGDPHRSPEAVAEGRSAAVALLAAAIPEDAPQADTSVRLLLPHIDAWVANSAGLDPLPSADGLFLSTAASLIRQDLQHRAVPCLKHVLHACEQEMGPAHHLTLALRVALASAYEEAGDITRAIPLFESALAGRRDVLGQDHPETVVTRILLAGAHEAAGGAKLAVDQLKDALNDSLRLFGPDGPQTLMARNNLAHAHGSAGRPDLAIPLYAEVLARQQEKAGPDLRNRLTARNNLAYAHRSAGRPDLAIPLYTELLGEIRCLLGPDHPQTLSIAHNLASAHCAAGDLEHAAALYERTADDRARVLGTSHPDTLTSRSDLALAYNEAGDERAVALAEAVLADRRSVLPAGHPDIMTSVNNLAVCCSTAGESERAIALFEEALESRTAVLGPDSPDTLTARNNLACAHAEGGRLDDALPVLRTVLDDRVRVLGRDHPDAIASRGTLGGAHRLAGNTDQALIHYEEAHSDARRVLGENHKLTQQLRSRLGAMGRKL
ncbi:tetratricopeptide repeat protein [Streptomyces sp. BR123]|uniref:FxSxx-COOH system tetratricopeptide repeat protein n=1 Tax=Streptomyces sp. BR123 TaxID=2749828 RepID=UPI0015C44FD3|nr:FxSxx-COOH system tetratricopeptide repeat protein [Streptomyces sp. BR123]NXY94808.1 tetratricopeptide repeat protein [Streptomyces sp. BR123]